MELSFSYIYPPLNPLQGGEVLRFFIKNPNNHKEDLADGVKEVIANFRLFDEFLRMFRKNFIIGLVFNCFYSPLLGD
jgi:hypothetical protein